MEAVGTKIANMEAGVERGRGGRRVSIFHGVFFRNSSFVNLLRSFICMCCVCASL